MAASRIRAHLGDAKGDVGDEADMECRGGTRRYRGEVYGAPGFRLERGALLRSYRHFVSVAQGAEARGEGGVAEAAGVAGAADAHHLHDARVLELLEHLVRVRVRVRELGLGLGLGSYG